ncbi:MAG: fructose-6-phosphate aldolase [Desulfitobacterium hafniense]|nr:fructose-6-phosphate aldolase [Desulfitobacterium hafniense]
MLYLLDTANITEIKKAYDLYPIAGVTTNPTIIAKEKSDFLAKVLEIRSLIGEQAMLHVQALGRTSEQIVAEADYLRQKVGGNLYVKVPVIPEGIKAMKLLKQNGIKLTATAIFTPQQALMAAVAGADFVAPYVNRLDNVCGDGTSVVGEIVQLFELYGLPSKVLAASFKSVEQVHKVSLYGGHAITASPDIIEQLLKHPLTDTSVEQFIRDWEGVYGAGKVISNI